MEVVWDGTNQGGRCRYLFTEEFPTRQARPMKTATSTIQNEILEALAMNPRTIGDIILAFEKSYPRSRIYTTMTALRDDGRLAVVRHEPRRRAQFGSLLRPVYGVAPQESV